MRIAVVMGARQADPIEQILHMLAAIGRRHIGMHLDRARDGFANCAARIERGIRILKYDLRVATERL